MRKKILSVVLSFSMILSTTGFAFADTDTETIQTEPTKIEKEVEQPTIVEQPKQEETQKIEVKKELQKEEIKKEETKEEVKEEEPQIEEQTPNADGSVTVHYKNGLSILKQHQDENGRPEPYETEVKLTKTQTKTQNSKGVLNYFGGKDYQFTYGGVTYTFLNVITEVDKDTTTPIYWETAEDGETIAKIGNKNSEITYTYNDKTLEPKVLPSRSDVYVAPVYHQKQNWFLEYNYIDNISTGDGSWSNLDAITQYKHTFSNPEVKSPSITEGKYQFKYWENETTGEKYFDGDSFIYTGLNMGHEDGYKEVINTYAYWQPAVVVNLYNGNELVKTISSFESISSSEFEKLADTDTQKFVGWLDENGALLDIYYAPGITKEEGYLIVNLTAQFEDIVIPVPTPDPESSVKPEPSVKPGPSVKPELPTVIPNKPGSKVITKTNNKTTYYGMGDGIEYTPEPKPAALPTVNIPFTAPTKTDAWALINLIATILTIILALILLIMYFINKRKENDEIQIKNKTIGRIIGAIAAVLTTIVFLITEDISLPMVLIDQWTLLMIILLVIQIIITILCKHKKIEKTPN